MQRFVFILLASLALVHGRSFHTDGNEYIYNSVVTMWAGNGELEPHQALATLSMKVRMQPSGNTFKFEFTDMKGSEKIGNSAAESTTPVDLDMGPVSFWVILDDSGLFQSLKYSSDLKLFQKNLVKAWASQMQLNVKALENGQQVSTEKTISGECDVKYAYTDGIIYKTVSHLKDCRSRSYRMVDDYRGYRCDQDIRKYDTFEKPEGFYSATSTSIHTEKEDDGDVVITKIKAVGGLVAQMFGTEGMSQTVRFIHESTLESRGPASGDIASGDAETSDLEYEFDDGDYKWNVDRDLKAREPFFSAGDLMEDDQNILKQGLKMLLNKQLEILKSIGHHTDETVEEAHRKGIQQLYPLAFGLDYDNLKALADELLADSSEEGVKKANIYLGLLGSVGSTASALLVRDLILDNKYGSDLDAFRALSAIPFHIRRPNTQLVEEFSKLLSYEGGKGYSEMGIPLAYGHLIRMTCERNHEHDARYECFKTFASKFVTKYFGKFTQATTRQEKAMALSTIFNIRYGGVAATLAPLAHGQIESTPEFQTQAIFAASYETLLLGKGVEFYMPIFANRNADREPRMAAITMMLRGKVSSTEIAQIMHILANEKDIEVVNYVLTLLKKVANSISPCDKDVGDLARFFLKYMNNKEPSNKFGISKTHDVQFHKDKFGYTGSYTYYTMGSDESMTPIRCGVEFSTNLFHSYESPVMGLHARAEGVSKAIIRKIKNMNPATWKSEDLQGIFNDMNIQARSDQPVRFSVILLIRGTAVYNRIYDVESFSSEKYADLGKRLMEMTEYSRSMQKVIQHGTMMYEIPSDVGLPMFYLSGMTILTDMWAKVKRGMQAGNAYVDVEYEYAQFTQGVSMLGFALQNSKVKYTVIQDRIYQARYPGKFSLGANLAKKEYKFVNRRPPHDNPLSFMIHSASVVARKSFKNADSANDRCVVISNGPNAKTDRVFLERESSRGGYYVKGEYFDCEMAVDKRTARRNIYYSFYPHNKNPKDLCSVFRMGMSQLYAFFIYFPKTEKCGLSLKYSQSEMNPVENHEITLKVKSSENGVVSMFKGRKLEYKLYVKAKGDQVQRDWRVLFSYEATPAGNNNKMKIIINRGAVSALNMPAYSFCLSYESQYPKELEEFTELDMSRNLEVTGKSLIRFGEGTTCENPEGEISYEFKHSTTDQARRELKNKWYYKRCMEDKQSQPWNKRDSSQLPVTHPCKLTVYDASTARKYTHQIKFNKMDEYFKDLIGKTRALMKAGLFPWDIEPENTEVSDNETPYMNFEWNFHNDDTLLDMKLETSQGSDEAHDYPLMLNWTPLLRNLRIQRGMKKFFESGILNSCITTTEDVRTLDNVTYASSLGECWTMVSGHCSDNPTYAVFAKKTGGALPMALNVHIGDHEVEFEPSGSSIKVKIDGQATVVPNYDEKVVEVKGKDLLQVYKWGSTYTVHSKRRVYLYYDGHYVNVIPAPSVYGQHCGLCGNFNRQTWDEFTGKNEQLITANEMAEEWKWKC